ncbi:MAG: glycosyltransferase family 4 protein [Actinomycetia bacterium]|nr:glycosyltransferase family 4 protein [Actinomycetes bacterium]
MPGGTGRATTETLAAFEATAGLNIQGVAAWHRRGERAVASGVGSITYLPVPRRLLYESWLRFGWPRVERHIGPVDVVWASSMIPVPSEAPMVATVHDLGFLDRPEHTSRRGRSFFPRAWAAIRDQAEIIVCPSQVVADDCQRRGVSSERLRVIPWGVSAPISGCEATESIRRSKGLPECFVLWVGTLEPRKNLHRLVEAMERIPDLHLAVVGPRGWNVDGTDVLAPLGGRAHRLGFVDDHDLSALYRAASVFAYPSILEGFGLPVLEAMAHGTPVVTAEATATAEVAAGTARLVDPNDPEAIAAAIEATLAEPEITKQLVAQGRRRAKELTWARTAEHYASVLCEAAAKGRSG